MAAQERSAARVEPEAAEEGPLRSPPMAASKRRVLLMPRVELERKEMQVDQILMNPGPYCMGLKPGATTPGQAAGAGPAALEVKAARAVAAAAGLAAQ